MMKRIFNMYADDKNSQAIKLLNYRNLMKFCQDFHFFQTSFDKIQLQVIYYKFVNSNRCEFQTFIEILWKIQSYLLQKNDQNDLKEATKTDLFKLFLDKNVLPIYKTLFLNLNDHQIEKVQVFYQNYNTYENPTVCLLYENDNLLKHVLQFYQSFIDNFMLSLGFFSL